jgi:hypothetical protein
MQAATFAACKAAPKATVLADLDVAAITEEDIEACFVAVKAAYDDLGGGDRVAKGKELVAAVKGQIEHVFN